MCMYPLHLSDNFGNLERQHILCAFNQLENVHNDGPLYYSYGVILVEFCYTTSALHLSVHSYVNHFSKHKSTYAPFHVKSLKSSGTAYILFVIYMLSLTCIIQAATRSCFYAGFAAQRNFAEVRV